MARTEPARGMRDFLPEDVRRRAHVIGIIARVYERYGFEPLETPAVENLETLLGKYGDEGNQLIFKILKRGEHEASGQADLALRYDLTVPLARVVAEYQSKLPKFFKRYQIQPVWRADRPARGRFREFYQCDIDSVGSKSLLVEGELIAAASEAMTSLGFGDFVIRLNHRGLLTLVLSFFFGLPESAHIEALVALDKLDKIGWSEVLDELETRQILSRSASMQALKGINQFADAEDTAHAADSPSIRALRRYGTFLKRDPGSDITRLEELREVFLRSPLKIDVSPVNDLIEILELSRNTPAEGRLRHDIFLARGLSYYTGAIMEIAVPDLAGSLGGGGRYDNLIGTFLGKEVPACGFSLGLERILVVMDEGNMFPQELPNSGVDFVVVAHDQEALLAVKDLAHSLRELGQSVDLYPEPVAKFSELFKYLDYRGAKAVVGVRASDVNTGTATLRDLRTRTNESLTVLALLDRVNEERNRNINGRKNES